MKVLIGSWALAVCVGFGALARYDGAAGNQVEAPAVLSHERSSRPHLLVFVHPECPCTSATLAELERIQAQTQGRLEIQIDAVIPKGNVSWLHSANLERARGIKDCNLTLDSAGKIAAANGAETSGFCILTSRNGKKVFQGGITLSRGHEGDNVGHDAIVEYVNQGHLSTARTPVYGCSLGDLGATW